MTHQLIKKLPALYGSRRVMAAFTTPLNWFQSWDSFFKENLYKAYGMLCRGNEFEQNFDVETWTGEATFDI
jgi:hypothetical protein